MKKSAYFYILVACFLGVFAALQLDRQMRAQSRPALAQPSIETPAFKAVPTSYAPADPQAAPIDFRRAAKVALPSVVSVDRYNQIVDWDQNPVGVRETGTGSGVILSADGTIVTNRHVVADADEVRVRLNDKRVFTAKVLGTDRRSDLAVLKIEASNLTPIQMGDSSAIEVGQWVLAVGNPLGYEGTVSVGVVSNLSRDLVAGGQSLLVGAIQTDAAINQGNSGGALTDAAGRLVGINTAIASNSGGSIGIGFAIPVNRVRRIAEDILRHGYPRYGGLGVTPLNVRLDVLSPRERQRVSEILGADPPTRGVIVNNVSPGSAAEQAGIARYSVLLEIDGERTDSILDLTRLLLDKKPGDKASVTYWKSGKVVTRSVTLPEVRFPD